MQPASASLGWFHADGLMTHHVHLSLETPDATLSKGLRQLIGVFTLSVHCATGSVICFSRD